EPGEPVENLFLEGFATDAAGRVRTRCEAPDRAPGAAGTDPLFAEQWHLVNTGQTAFSNRSGTAGADLRMGDAIGAGHNGEGVKLAVIDTGLEICHPDLAANTSAGGSFNFAHESTPGASSADPFNQSILGEHGTSVAGIAAAVANNGLGGRGVAPEVTLVGFNLGSAVAEDLETALYRSLGASDSDPDSASVDIFNMSFGSELPSENATEDFVRVMKMGTSELRSGRGALYVKAAGNEFELCNRAHPLNREIGCISGNADPDQNLPYLIAVGAFNADDVKSSYSNAGANLWVVGPGGEDGFERPAMITTDQAGAGAGFGLHGEIPLSTDHPLHRDGDYVNAFGGTSSAAPAVAGAGAVLLGAKPNLTWRDVKHILAVTARRIDPGRAEVRAAFNGTPYVVRHAWQTNAAGHDYHNWYGFGAVDIDAAVALAQSTYAPGSLGTFVESEWFESGADGALALAIPDADGAGASAVLDVSGLPESADIEAVVLEIDVEHSDAFDLGVTLHSPAGTASVLNPPFNAVLEDFSGLRNWQLLSNAFYGENPNGAWTVHVADLAAEDTGSLTGWRLRFYYGEHP
ncbi:MAG: S8 family serine peptidase, partial [Proteobacteria bacterium]|nr:S8 family serine peptidase [Pseudomonadota bacterium]